MRLVIVTGMSGAGKSTAMKIMEDMGYFCIDNLPVAFFEKLVEVFSTANQSNIAIGMDARSGQDLDQLNEVLIRMKEGQVPFEILFLDASDSVLVKRYKETRRSHPRAKDERVDKGIEREREKIAFLRGQADYMIDTSNMLTRELKTRIEDLFVHTEDYKSMVVTVLSFGFKYGIPEDSDIVMDVRFLPNPYYDLELRPKTGNDAEIRDFVMGCKDAVEFSDKLEDMVKFLIPHYISEGKNQLIISIGCTGGKHRSVTLANELYKRLEGGSDYGLKLEHRDILKDALRGK